MTLVTVNPEPLWYRIGDAARLVGVEPHVIRYWETAFKLRPERSRKGQRVYSRRLVERLLRIRELLYVEGYTIRGAKRRLELDAQQAAQRASEAASG